VTHFFRLLNEFDKASALQNTCQSFRNGQIESRVFSLPHDSFDAVPGKPFAYWVSGNVRQAFALMAPFEDKNKTVRQGLATADDFRFVRCFWEIRTSTAGGKWFPMAKGGAFSPFYADLYLSVNWSLAGAEIKAGICQRYPYLNGNPDFVAKNTDFYFRPGLTWPLRAKQFCPQVLPQGVVISVRGSGIYSDDPLLYLALLSSRAADVYLRMLSGREGYPQYDMGDVSALPVPIIDARTATRLRQLARMGWAAKRARDTIEETSHAFILPASVRNRVGDYDSSHLESVLSNVQAEIDEIAFDLYKFTEADRHAARAQISSAPTSDELSEEESPEDTEPEVPPVDALLSWAVGVSFGRFDWRLATGERDAPPDPDPFDPLPANSPGMLPDGAEPFSLHGSILVEDQGHPHDLPRLVEEVLVRIKVSVPEDVRRWSQRDFFAFHLQRYSKSRRKAPIYWPLSTTSGSYTLWVYCPSLTSQTLYTAVNDLVEPKLQQVGADVTALRNRGSARTRDDEKRFEALQAFELELIELRDTLLKLAPTYKPNHDDGVQISAAPLWPLFRHKPWQKVLKDTWAKLEKGDYDWAYLAMNYWPERVREKCKTDKSLAIAHGLEHLYIELEVQPKKTRGRKKAGGDE
jgi:hypothetical protein